MNRMRLIEQAPRIESWFEHRWQETPAPLTSSVDIRDAGFKCSPVDTNLYPAGFNNLNQAARIKAAGAFYDYFYDKPGLSTFLIIPEAHTRNVHYSESVKVLKDIVQAAGFVVHVLQEPIQRLDDRITLNDFNLSALILNNYFSEVITDTLKGLSQPIYPSLELGWSRRLKSSHFGFLDEVIVEFSEHMGVDAWALNPLFDVVDDIDFMQKKGLERLALVADEMLARIRTRYHQQGIEQSPYLVIKADNGTYGMSVMMIHDGQELLELNRKQRTRMSTRKGSQSVSRVLLQEGVYSILKHENGAVAEPVMMMIGATVIGGFYRLHDAKGDDDNLNSPGMYFEAIGAEFDSPQFYFYGVVARLAALAAAREIEAARRQS